MVILPDIEKRLEAFARLAHAIVVFPGGAGTIEEILYALSIKLNPANTHVPLPLIFTGPESASGYFNAVDNYLRQTLGDSVAEHYQLVPNNPAAVAAAVRAGVSETRSYRKSRKEAYNFNWRLHLNPTLQQPFLPTHANMAALNLDANLPAHVLASQLRRAMSGIVAGNVKADGIAAVRKHGPFQLSGTPRLLQATGNLLDAFIAQGRMKLGPGKYEPCYEIAAG